MPINLAKPDALDKLADQHMATTLGIEETTYRRVKARREEPSATMIAAMRVKFHTPLEKWTDAYDVDSAEKVPA